MVDHIGSKQGRDVPIYTWCFYPSLLSTFNLFCPDFFEERVYWQLYFDQMDTISLHN